MDLSGNIQKASKWSLLTEILTKLMSPIINMILARLIAPEAFGMVATITMVISFADIFTDAGFQKYIIQKNIQNETDLDKDTNVAFWTNIILSCFLWLLIFIFRNGLASAVGNAGLGNAIAIAAIALPLTSFSSIQMARYRRSFDFKTLFFAKLIGIFIPIFITVPLAFFLKNFWAIIIGNLAINLSNAILLTIRSNWKPKLYYNVKRLKEMISFSIWTLTEQLLGWANLNVGIFVVGKYLSDYYLGLYKISMATTNQILLIAVNAFSPVLFSALSRLKEKPSDFYEMFYSFVKKIGFIVLPLGVGIFVYQDLFTLILLGSKWKEAATFIGLWGMLRSINIVFGYFSMEVFVSLGKPKFSVLTQFLELIILIPVLFVTADKGYESVYLSRCAVVVWSIVVEMFLLKKVTDISTNIIIKDTLISFLGAVTMGILGWIFIHVSNNIIWQIISVFICIVFYFMLMFLFPKTRKIEQDLLKIMR